MSDVTTQTLDAPADPKAPYAVVFDTETTGLPQKKLSADHPEQAYPIQLGWITCNTALEPIAEKVVIIAPPPGTIMHPRAQQTHGKSIDYCMRHGVPFEEALKMFRADLDASEVRAAYNIEFDDWIMKTAYLRHNPGTNVDPLKASFGDTYGYCVMKQATAKLQVPNGNGGYRNLKLHQVYTRITKRKMLDAHDALGDVRATLTVWRELMSVTPIPIDPESI